MSAAKVPWAPLLVWSVVVVGLPLAAHWARRPSDPGCALDGAAVDPVYRVKVLDGRGQWRAFCCLRCAQIWIRDQAVPPRAVTVTDEPSGDELPAGAAEYVRSSVVTTPTTGNRVHVFRRRADADRHAAAFGGTVLAGSERPFPRDGRARPFSLR
jgi:hypothetical protein